MLNRLIAVIADQRSQWCLHTALLCQHLCVPLCQILPILNRHSRSKRHRLLVVAEAELNLAVLSELAGAEKVIGHLLQSLFLLRVRCVRHLHTCCVLQFDGFGLGYAGELGHMNYFIIRNIELLAAFAGDELERVSELLLPLRHVEELVESEHLVQLVLELVTLGPGDEFVSSLTAEFECALRRECILRSVHHGELALVVLLRCQEIDLQ